MIDTTTLVTYLVILTGFVFIPGPAVLLTLARASLSGTRAGLSTALGIAVGDLVHTVMAVVGISAILYASATAFTVVKYLGAAYLIYLGIRAFLDNAAPDRLKAPVRMSAFIAFRQAVLAEVLNPKSALFFLAFLPQFVKPENGSVALQLTVLGVLFVLMGLVSTVITAIAAARVGAFLKHNPVVLRWQNRVVGTIFCALGIRLALQER